jgi:hypothetical protein
MTHKCFKTNITIYVDLIEIYIMLEGTLPVTVAERSKACLEEVRISAL